MGVWDALGRGIQAGADAYLAGKLRQDEKVREAAMQKLREEQFALQRFQARQGMEQWETEQATAEQLRAEERHRMMDPRSVEPGINIPMYQEISPGAFVPIPQAERDQMYAEQMAANLEQQRQLSAEDLAREKELAEYRARMQHKYSYPPAHVAEGKQAEEPFFVGGAVNPTGAFNALNSFIQLYGGSNWSGFWTNSRLQEDFLRSIELRYSTEVPNAKELARLWLMQQTVSPPPTTDIDGDARGSGFFERQQSGFEQFREKLGGLFGGGVQTQPVTDPVRSQIEGQVRTVMGADTPEDIVQDLVEEEYRKYVRNQPFTLPETTPGTPPAKRGRMIPKR